MANLEEVKYPLVVVSWYDHMSDDDWCHPDKVTKAAPLMCVVGWLVYENDHILNLAQRVGDTEVACQFIIIKSCIVERKEL